MNTIYEIGKNMMESAERTNPPLTAERFYWIVGAEAKKTILCEGKTVDPIGLDLTPIIKGDFTFRGLPVFVNHRIGGEIRLMRGVQVDRF